MEPSLFTHNKCTFPHQHLLDVSRDHDPRRWHEEHPVVLLAELPVPVQLELVDVEDHPGEVADEEGHGDAGEDHQQGLLLGRAGLALQAGKKFRLLCDVDQGSQ